jgi:hypothetical protein
VNQNASLFAPRPAYRFRFITEPMTMPDDATEGRNPPYGANIDFYLKTAPKSGAPTDSDGAGSSGSAAKAAIKLVIGDASGKTVRTLEVKEPVAGINRAWWDLRTDPTPEIKLRTPPLYVPDFPMAADGTRKFPTAGPMSVLVPPGTYTVKLVGAGPERTASLTVRKDPNTEGTEPDIAAQTKVMMQIYDDTTTVAKAINAAETVRAQIAQLKARLGDGDAVKGVKASADELDGKIADIESRLFNLTATGRGQDQLRTPSQMVEKLSHLADVVAYADFRPTDSQVEMQAKLAQDIARDGERLNGTFAREVANFNAMLRDRQLGAIVVPAQ